MEQYISIAIKLLVSLISLVVVIRIIGQKELAQTTPIDLVFLMMLAEIVGGMVQEKKFNVGHIIFTVVFWGVFIWLAEKLSQRKKLERWIDGKPEILIQNGTVNARLMKKEHLTMQELETELRKQGVFNLKDVRLGILEIDGSISVLRSKNTKDLENVKV
ncbi:MAG TPA: YetF domain-containing protein [Ureibacillus sp.]|nr:YetF domain-containing protein [Ureibacillus sp.]